jgi:hypothetical protein
MLNSPKQQHIIYSEGSEETSTSYMPHLNNSGLWNHLKPHLSDSVVILRYHQLYPDLVLHQMLNFISQKLWIWRHIIPLPALLNPTQLPTPDHQWKSTNKFVQAKRRAGQKYISWCTGWLRVHRLIPPSRPFYYNIQYQMRKWVFILSWERSGHIIF